jgi:hypothetical protein
VSFEDWKEDDLSMFYDLIGREVGEAGMNMEKANRLKKAYGNLTILCPYMVVEYCVNLKIPPLNYIVKKPLIMDEFENIIPYYRP